MCRQINPLKRILMIVSLLFVILFYSPIRAQNDVIDFSRKSIAKGDIYALVIGISDYQDPAIGDLAYADRDAQVFADFLSSKGGGAVPKSNMRVLINQEATISNIYAAKYWLESKAKKDDLVFFYFSGHGDVENSLYNLGFLLAHDSPKGNYLNNAIRVEDFNNMANTLSVKKSAQVVFITDACRSGGLAGADNRGRLLVGSQLSKVQKNEIRMTSCGADELSQENKAWGGGRGAFSFHLINGLKGDADADEKDGKVTLSELRRYLEKRVFRDVFELKSVKQTPIIDGPPMMNLALVDKSTDLSDIETMDPSLDDGSTRSVDFVEASADSYFSQFRNVDLKDRYDFKEWAGKSPFDFAKNVLKTFDFEGQSEWKQNYIADQQDFHFQLAAAIHDEVQRVINAYLGGDEKELERRKYYNAGDREFEEYRHMLQVAMNLVDKSSQLHHMMEVKKHYFAGMDLRLQMGIVGINDASLHAALEEQEKALALDENAAYVHNEIGVLSKIMKKTVLSHYHYTRASELAPSWAIPKSNLANLYHTEGMYEHGISMGREAVAAQGDLLNAHVNLGVNAEKTKNLLLAEQCFVNATRLNDRSVSAHQGLGYVYLHSTDYARSNQHFQKADDILNDLYDDGPQQAFMDMDADGVVDMSDYAGATPPDPCTLDPSKFGEGDFMATFVYGMVKAKEGDTVTAESFIKQSILQNGEHPLAYHYLANFALDRGEQVKAEYLYLKASDRYLDAAEFETHVSESIEWQTYTDCQIEHKYNSYQYLEAINSFVLGAIYEKQRRYHSAIVMYEDAVVQGEIFYGYYKLWTLYEALQLFEQAEHVLTRFVKEGQDQADSELFAFYKRNIARNINTHFYKHKIAMMLLERVDVDDRDSDFELDYVKLYDVYQDVPKETQEDMRPDFIPSEAQIPGTGELVEYASPIPVNKTMTLEALTEVEAFMEEPMDADIYHKIGMLHLSRNDFENAKSYFDKAVAADPTNYSDHARLARFHYTNLQYEAGYDMLYNLYQVGAISYNHKLQLGMQSVLAGHYERSDTLLREVSDIAVPPPIQVEQFQALRSLLDSDWDKALDQHTGLLEKVYSKKELLYTLCRIEAQRANVDIAVDYLAQARSAGFDYYWVLVNDPLIVGLHHTDIYKQMIEQ